MGGGSIWRGVSRVVTPAVRVGSASTGSACSFCNKVGASAQASRAQSVRLRSCACTPGTTSKAATSSVSQQGSALWDADEWEFAEEEEKVDHLVFGSLPSRTEIEEASSELRNALKLGLVAPQVAEDSRALSPTVIKQSGPPVESSFTVGNEVRQGSDPNLIATQLALDWVEPPPIRSWQGVLPAGRRAGNVAHALHQFQHNPEVQSMVVSLAADPAIWDAVAANEKIQEFKRKLQKEQAAVSSNQGPALADVKNESQAEEGDSQNIFTRLQSFWQTKWAQFMDALSHLIDGLFTAADRKVFAEEDGDFIDRTVKSCTMLALIVLSVVILKRLAVQAA